MLRWSKNCYFGENVQNPDRIKEKLENGRAVAGIYLLTLSENPHNLLEIFSSVTLMQRTAADLCPEIVGIAHGKEEAMKLVTDLVQKVYTETGDVQVKEYLKNR